MTTLPGTKGRVLLVDDEPSILTALTRVLGKANWDIETASDGVVALEKAKTFLPHVVVSDFRMPRMNGLELFEQLDALSPVPQRILLTGQADPDAVTAAVDPGRGYEVVFKPWENAALITLVTRAFARTQGQVAPAQAAAAEQTVPQVPTPPDEGFDLVRGLVHELNNALGGFLTLSQMLKAQGDAPVIDRSMVVAMHDAALHCTHTLATLGRFARPPGAQPQRSDLAHAATAGIAQFLQIVPRVAVTAPTCNAFVSAHHDDVAQVTAVLLRVLEHEAGPLLKSAVVSCAQDTRLTWSLTVAGESTEALDLRREVESNLPFLAQLAQRLLARNDARLYVVFPATPLRLPQYVAVFRGES